MKTHNEAIVSVLARRLNREIEAYKNNLSDPQLFSRDPELFQKTADGLARAEATLAEREERWLELELLRENLES